MLTKLQRIESTNNQIVPFKISYIFAMLFALTVTTVYIFMSNLTNQSIPLRIAMGAYALGVIVWTYYCIINRLQPGLFWHDLFSSYLTSAFMSLFINKLTFLFTLITLMLPIFIVKVAIFLFEKKDT